jgi:hypothetical protein
LTATRLSELLLGNEVGQILVIQNDGALLAPPRSIRCHPIWSDSSVLTSMATVLVMSSSRAGTSPWRNGRSMLLRNAWWMARFSIPRIVDLEPIQFVNAAADFDGDTKMDLASGPQVYRGRGDGTFLPGSDLLPDLSRW